MDRRAYKTVLPYILRHRLKLALCFILAGLSAILSLYIPKLTGKAVDCLTGPGNTDIRGLIGMLIRIGAVALISGVFQFFVNVLSNSVTYEVVRDIRNDAFKRIEELPLRYLDAHLPGETVNTVIADADLMSDGLLMGCTQLFTGIVTIVGTFVFMLFMDIRIALLVAVLTPLSVFAAKFIASRTYTYAKDFAHERGEETGFVTEMMEGCRIISAFNREDEVKKEFDRMNGALTETSMKATFFSSLVNPSTRAVNNLIYASVAVSGALSAFKGLMSVGELVSFLSYASQYMRPFNEISGVVAELQGALASASRLSSIINEEPEEPDKPGAKELTDPKGAIELKNVSFSYDPAKKLIENLNLLVSPGQRIAIVGPTGSGKTTLINLLMRFYDTDRGEILFDGTPIREITRKSLRDSFGMVLQDTWLRSGTIRDNLTMGDDTVSDEEMIRVSKLCHTHSFIRKLPDKYDTVIGEDDNILSAGQKQLLCIARVMLSRPSMLILDEATSSIDTRTELLIQEAFDRIQEGKTSFIVAHRLSTVREADSILVMKNGRIIESGDHKELMEKRGFYYDLLNSQFLGHKI